MTLGLLVFTDFSSRSTSASTACGNFSSADFTSASSLASRAAVRSLSVLSHLQVQGMSLFDQRFEFRPQFVGVLHRTASRCQADARVEFPQRQLMLIAPFRLVTVQLAEPIAGPVEIVNRLLVSGGIGCLQRFDQRLQLGMMLPGKGQGCRFLISCDRVGLSFGFL